MGNDGLRAKGSHSLGRWLRGALEKKKTAGVVATNASGLSRF